MLSRIVGRDLNDVQILDMSLESSIDGRTKKPRVPFIDGQGFLKDFMKDRAVDEGFRWSTARSDPVLKHCSAHAAERVRDDCRGYQLIGVEDKDILGVVDDTFAAGFKVPDDVNKRFCARWGVIPILSQMNHPDGTGPVGLNNQDLRCCQ